MRNSLAFALLFFIGNLTFGQGNGGTFNGINKCYKKKFSVAIHVIEDTTGATNITDVAIAADIAALNTIFAPVCASFDICSTYYHPNVRSDTVDLVKNIQNIEIATLYDVPMVINIYYVEEIVSPISPCGFAPLGGMSAPAASPTRDAIFIKKSCSGGGKTIMHEVGHYFGLYHTFETSTGVELADGSNCTTTGDLVCDTPGDPYVDTTTTMDSFCNLEPPITDTNGDYYTPNACNIMSYYTNSCEGRHFTTGQYNRMLEVMQKGRNYLW